MRWVFLLLFIIFALANSLTIGVCQTNWYPAQRLTNGYVDKNPSFGNKTVPQGMALYNSWEMFVFERHISPYSQICVLKMGTTSYIDSVVALTSNLSLKRNPSISYDKVNFNYGTLINSILILWETNQNGKWDIYGRHYSAQNGWGTVFPLDTTAGNKSKPKSVCMDSLNFAVTYEKNGDIFFKKIFIPTLTVQYDTCLTSNDTAYCRNPFITKYYSYSTPNFFIVTYEKTKSDNKTAIYFRKSSSLPVWSVADTIAYNGNSKMNSFTITPTFNICAVFESDRPGYSAIYGTEITPGSNLLTQSAVYTNNQYPRQSFVSVWYPVITDYIFVAANACIKRGTDSIKIKLDDRPGPYMYPDSITIGDTSKQTSLTMNGGIYYQYNSLIWVVYSKDSASYTKLWAKRRLVNLGAVKRISTEVPETFQLLQNYPNPFNPTTKIKFDIPNLPLGRGVGGMMVSLKVFDITGREIQTLVNEPLSPGTYEVTFDGSNLPSGIYFYQLRSGEYLETKKLVLLK